MRCKGCDKVLGAADERYDPVTGATNLLCSECLSYAYDKDTFFNGKDALSTIDSDNVGELEMLKIMADELLAEDGY